MHLRICKRNEEFQQKLWNFESVDEITHLSEEVIPTLVAVKEISPALFRARNRSFPWELCSFHRWRKMHIFREKLCIFVSVRSTTLSNLYTFPLKLCASEPVQKYTFFDRNCAPLNLVMKLHTVQQKLCTFESTEEMPNFNRNCGILILWMNLIPCKKQQFSIGIVHHSSVEQIAHFLNRSCTYSYLSKKYHNIEFAHFSMETVRLSTGLEIHTFRQELCTFESGDEISHCLIEVMHLRICKRNEEFQQKLWNFESVDEITHASEVVPTLVAVDEIATF